MTPVDAHSSFLATRRGKIAGYGRALLAGSVALLVAAVVALRIANTRGETQSPASTTPASEPIRSQTAPVR